MPGGMTAPTYEPVVCRCSSRFAVATVKRAVSGCVSSVVAPLATVVDGLLLSGRDDAPADEPEGGRGEEQRNASGCERHGEDIGVHPTEPLSTGTSPDRVDTCLTGSRLPTRAL